MKKYYTKAGRDTLQARTAAKTLTQTLSSSSPSYNSKSRSITAASMWKS